MEQQEQLQQKIEQVSSEAREAVIKIETQVQAAWKRNVKWIALGILALALISLAVNRFWPKPAPAPTTYTAAAPIPAVANVPTVELPPQRVVVLVKQEAIKKLPDLPPEIKNDPKQQITATADIPPSPNGGSAVAFINRTTGRSGIIYKAKPQPLIGFPSDITVGVRYGVTTRAPGQEGQLYGKWDFFRVGKAYLGMYGEVNTRPEAKGMIDLSMRF